MTSTTDKENSQDEGILQASSEDGKLALDTSVQEQKLDVNVAQLESSLDTEINDIVLDEEDEVSPLLHNELIYAVGELKPSFSNKGLEQAFNAAARALAVSEYDYYKVFSYVDVKTQSKPYFYLAQQMDWVLSINHDDCYLLVPQSQVEMTYFIDALDKPTDSLQVIYSIAVGRLNGTASYAQGRLPQVLCDHLFSQTMDELHSKLQSDTGAATSAIQAVLKQLEFSPNHGDNNFDRAKNYLAFRYPDIYSITHSMQSNSNTSTNINTTSSSYFLDSISCNHSDVMSPHTIVDIVLTYKSKSSREEKYYHCSVDVTRQYPFINTPLSLFMPVKTEQG